MQKWNKDNMNKHYIIKKNIRQDAKGRPTSVATNSDNNCYPTMEAALHKAEKLAENAQAPQLIIYEAVKVVEQERPKITVTDIGSPWHDTDTECEDTECVLPSCSRAQGRYSCKDNNCEDTECRRCFPTHE